MAKMLKKTIISGHSIWYLAFTTSRYIQNNVISRFWMGIWRPSTKFYRFWVLPFGLTSSLQNFFGTSQNVGRRGVLKPLFILTMALHHFEVLKSLNPLVNLLEMILFSLLLWLTTKRATSILKRKENAQAQS